MKVVLLHEHHVAVKPEVEPGLNCNEVSEEGGSGSWALLYDEGDPSLHTCIVHRLTRGSRMSHATLRHLHIRAFLAICGNFPFLQASMQGCLHSILKDSCTIMLAFMPSKCTVGMNTSLVM
jgi:hypothetical protein